MQKMRARASRVVCAIGAAGLLALGVGVAEAQPGRRPTVDLTEVRPPAPPKQDTPPVIMSYMLLAVLVAAAIGANTIPSKRGHQD